MVAEVKSRLQSYGEGTENQILSRLGLTVQIPLKDQLAMAGNVFVSTGTASRTDGETGEIGAGAMAIDPAEPSFMFDVPPGLCVLPLYVNISFEAIEDAEGIVGIMSDEIERYSSGGVAAVAARTNGDRRGPGTGVRNLLSGDTAITAATAKAERIHYLWSALDAYTAAEGNKFQLIEWKPNPGPVLIGPASFLVYVHGYNTGATEFHITTTWAELPREAIL